MVDTTPQGYIWYPPVRSVVPTWCFLCIAHKCDEIACVFLGVLGDISEDTFESLAHVGTAPRPNKAELSHKILERGLGPIGNIVPRRTFEGVSSLRILRKNCGGSLGTC